MQENGWDTQAGTGEVSWKDYPKDTVIGHWDTPGSLPVLWDPTEWYEHDTGSYRTAGSWGPDLYRELGPRLW